MTTETDLSSVNSILGSIGQAPVSRIYNKVDGELVYINPEIAFVHQILKEVDTDVQNEGWTWNTEFNYETLPKHCLLYTSPSPRDRQKSRMPSSA